MKHPRVSDLILSFAATAICVLAQQKPLELNVSPGFLYTKSETLKLRVYAPWAGERLVARWNGSERPMEKVETSVYDVAIMPEDVSRPGLAELSFADSRTQVVMATTLIPVLYNVQVKDVVFDSSRKRFYLVTSRDQGDTRFPANSLMALDPESGEVGPTLDLGDAPTSLALSRDGSALYVAVDGAGMVRRVDPVSFQVVSEFRFRPDISGGWLGAQGASRVAVAPNDSSMVALLWRPDLGMTTTRLSVFDAGKQRPSSLRLSDGLDGIAFAPDGKSILAGSFQYIGSPSTISRFSIDSSGVPEQTPVTASGGGPVAFIDDLLYTSGGPIVDLRTMEVVSSLGVGGCVAVDPIRRRLLASYYVMSEYSSDYPVYLQAFDMGTQEPLGWQRVGSVSYFNAGRNPVQRLFQFGEDGLLLTADQGLLLFHTPLAGPAPEFGEDSIYNSSGNPVSRVTPGETITIFGANLGPESEQTLAANALGRREPSLAGVQVWFDRFPGTVVQASKGRIDVVVPRRLLPDDIVSLQVWYYGIPSGRVPLQVGVPTTDALSQKERVQ